MATTKRMLKCWKEFDLTSVQKSLDLTASGIAKKQDESDASRKILIEKTREFKSSVTEETRKQVTPLIKALQTEVDSLTKRSKFSENAFLSIYKQILEVPDPVPLLDHAQAIQQQLTKAQNFELENRKLCQTLDEYHTEFADVKNQEVTINKLREKLKEYEDTSDDRLETKLKTREKDLEAAFTEKEKVFQECQMSLAVKLGETEQRAKLLQHALDDANSELFDVKVKSEEETSARNAELEIVSIDLEKANQRLLLAERHVESLNEQLMTTKSANEVDPLPEVDAHHLHSTVELEVQLAARERELAQLVQEVHFLQSSLNKQKETLQKEIDYLESRLQDCKLEMRAMHSRLDEQNDYDDIKQELGILKVLEFSASHNVDKGDLNSKSLEKLLLEKSRTLQSENSSLKIANHNLSAQVPDLERKCTEYERKISGQTELIGQLESDLLNVNALPTYCRGEGEGQANPESTAVEKAVGSLADKDPSTTIQLESDSLLPIITSQRERFKTRNLELETQTRNQQQEITILRHELETVRTDNVKLYEKIKFLQSYSQDPDRNRGEDDSVQRYGSHYEQKMDPFSAFSKREKQKRYASLSAPERATLNMGRFVLSNKIARTIVFFYTIFLHCLVFLVLYKMAYTESCKRDLASDCAKRFAAHMNDFHTHR